ncbi:hypothetical protein [Treponema sp.]|uniref:hypothetical protein n=1 Tax=Treponema sp. TaxID=166 RepID=UPI0025EA361D|nr:hypothetical protein [Treponema sp.]MBR4321210.1 hypothetical protein [Treponema sp.]
MFTIRGKAECVNKNRQSRNKMAGVPRLRRVSEHIHCRARLLSEVPCLRTPLLRNEPTARPYNP